MIIAVTAHKGGVGKTTTAIHIAAYLNTKAPTLLADCDENQSSRTWAQRGLLPFPVCDERQIARRGRDFQHIVLDTEVSPKLEDVKSLAESCDLIVVPTTPDALSISACLMMADNLKKVGASHYNVLLSIVPPLPSHAGDDARATLKAAHLPLFKGHIRRFVAFQKAALSGVLVSEVDDDRAEEAASDYLYIAKEIMR